MSNVIAFSCRAGIDAKLESVGSTTVLKFRAANNVYASKEKQTNWFHCSMWGKRGESLEQYIKKGQELFVTGELYMRPWTTKEGAERISADVNVTSVDLIGGKPQEKDDTLTYEKKPEAKEEPSEDLPF